MMDKPKAYAERCLSLTKESFDEPWRLMMTHPYDDRKSVSYRIENMYATKGTTYKKERVVGAGERLAHILRRLHERIESYPYAWALEGEKLDAYGYDLELYMNGDMDTMDRIDWTEVAETIIRTRLSIEPPEKGVWRELEPEEYVEGPGAGIRVEIEFEKAGPVNHVSLELVAAKDIELKALLFQEDTKRYTPMREVILQDGMTIKSNRSLTVNLPQPVYAKKMVLILVQREYAVNRYILPANYRAKAALLSLVREREATKTAGDVSSRKATLDFYGDSTVITDLFRRSGLEGYAEAMRKYKTEYEQWLKEQKK